jgi:hypothetical protein
MRNITLDWITDDIKLKRRELRMSVYSETRNLLHLNRLFKWQTAKN